jgi:TolA-binding protein
MYLKKVLQNLPAQLFRQFQIMINLISSQKINSMQGKRIFFQVLFFILFLSFHSVGQQTAIYKDPEYTFRKALELFEKQKYGAARQEFKKVAEEEPAGSVQLIALSEYYGALCALELYNKDGEQLMLSFIHNHPESSNVPSARFRLGRFYFSQKRYKDAARNFEMSDPAVLSNADVAEYYFKLGYSYFILNDFQKAVKAFHEIRGTDTKYASPALFYYSHIEYQNRNYETALQNFFKLRNAEGFTQIVPYYIAQIYYLQAKYDSLIAYAPALIERSGIQNTAEIARLLGDAYFRKSDYKNAAEYLELYGKNGGKTSREESYQLGFSLYKTGQFDEALNNLEKVTDKKDSLSQNALYVMADCYLKTGSRQKARNSFLLASAEDFDKAVKEESFLNYAKLSSELGMQSEAINAFQKYLRMYPASSRRDEINEILAGLFLQTKNYKEALEALESIKAKSEKIRKAYQKVAYFRGVELYSNLMFNEAAEYFEI